MSKRPQFILHKPHLRGNEHLICSRIPTLPALVFQRISKENTGSGLRLERLALVLLHMDVRTAAKDPEVRSIRLAPVECFIGSLARDGRGGGEVQDMDEAG